MNEKWYSAIKYGVLNNIYKITGVHLHKEITMNQFYTQFILLILFLKLKLIECNF
jgi:hypothetical protein